MKLLRVEPVLWSIWWVCDISTVFVLARSAASANKNTVRYCLSTLGSTTADESDEDDSDDDDDGGEGVLHVYVDIQCISMFICMFMFMRMFVCTKWYQTLNKVDDFCNTIVPYVLPCTST